MVNKYTILVADRNRHVRELLRRELSNEGYEILLAKDDVEVMTVVDGNGPPDVVILDLEIPCLGTLTLLEKLENRNPPLPLVIHTLPTDYTRNRSFHEHTAYVEKSGDTDRLKTVVKELILRFYPGSH